MPPGLLAQAVPPDTAVVVSPLPGGAAAVFRWLFNRPQWVQVGGLVLGIAIGLVLLALAWRHRRALGAWLGARSHVWKVGVAVGLGVLVVALVGTGAKTWNFMQHDNGFCVSCHVMTPAFSRFQNSEHRKLECHDCHRQSIFASARQMYFWVAERPEKIPPHAKVPTRVCSECHVQRDADSTWKRIVATAGHRVHLESDSSALAKVQCVTCHGQEVHRFVPVDRTCAQSGCHEQVQIKLGKMRDQTSLHCTGCHAFTRNVSESVPMDSARHQLVPAQQECFGCHEMREKMPDFDPLLDPHKGSCGACHDPHKQETPKAAFQSCTTSGCHVRPDTLTAFHRGIASAALARCGDCHMAHSWSIKETKCVTCHAGIFRDDGAATRPSRQAVHDAPVRVPQASWHRLATMESATRRQEAPVLARPASWHSIAMPAPVAQQQAAPALRGKFSHQRHRDVACTQCHSMARTHGELTVRTARDCQSCHHAADKRAGECTRCHAGAEIAATRRNPQPMRLTVWREPRTRPLPFEHGRHREVACTTCHAQPVTMAVERACTSCHAEHHEPTRTCGACHIPPKAAHTRAAHLGCAGSGCHGDKVSPTLAATRSTCLTCHATMASHRPGRECATCHQVSWRPGAVHGTDE